MPTSATNESTQAAGLRKLEDLRRTGTTSLDKDAFLKLLVAQLSNQDPMQPNNDTEFIAQLAQFSALEQMSSLNQATTANQAYSLMGKYAYADMTGQGTDYVFGRVEGVVVQGGETRVVIGEHEYPLSAVTAVVSAVDRAGETALLQSANLIGRRVVAEVFTEDGEPVEVSGEVSQILLSHGDVYAIVDGTRVHIGDIQQILP